MRNPFTRSPVVGPTILAHLQAHLDPARPGLLRGGADLPDSAPRDPNAIRFAPGALDGIMAHHTSVTAPDAVVDEVFTLIARTLARARRGTDAGLLYERVRRDDVIALADPLLERIRGSVLPAGEVHRLGRWLAEEGRHRQPVKLGVVMMGVGSSPATAVADRPLLITLGRHAEFTRYCTMVIASHDPDAERTLFDLARVVDGWSRINLVHRLKGTADPEIKEWLLRDGFRDAIIPEYLAYTCAVAGELADRLAADTVDDGLLDTAGELISALIEGGPAENIDDYDDAPLVLERYVDLVARAAPRLGQFVTLADMAGFLADDEWEERFQGVWTPAARERLAAARAEQAARPVWRGLAEQGLLVDEHVEFHCAVRTASALGIDTVPAHLRRIAADPRSSSWFYVMRDVDAQRLPEVLAIARSRLPLEQLCPGADHAVEPSADFPLHRSLDSVVTGLSRFPGAGTDLVILALRSPLVRNRTMAVRTLDTWGRDAWPDDIAPALRSAAAVEPDDDVRTRMAGLLLG